MGDIDTVDSHGSVEPTYLFGDPLLNNDMSNLKQFIKDTPLI